MTSDVVAFCFDDTIIALCLKIFRHGDRTPVDPYPNDPWKDRIYWPEGYGQLTNVSFICT